MDQTAISQHCERENGQWLSVMMLHLRQALGTFNIAHCQNVAGTHAYFNMKQDSEQNKCECIFTSTANITFDITGYKHMSQQRTNFVRHICIGNVHQSCLKCQC